MDVDNTLRAVANANSPETVRNLLGGDPGKDLRTIFEEYVKLHSIKNEDNGFVELASRKVTQLGETSESVREIRRSLAKTPIMVMNFVKQLPQEDREGVIDRLRGISDLSVVDKVVAEAKEISLPLRASFVLKWADQLSNRSRFLAKFPDANKVLDSVKREEVIKRVPKEIVLSEIEEPTAKPGEFKVTNLKVSSADLVDSILKTIEQDPNHLFQISDFGIPEKFQAGFHLDSVVEIFDALYELGIIQSFEWDNDAHTIQLSTLPSSAKSSAEASRTSSSEEVRPLDITELDIKMAEGLGLERDKANQIGLIDDKKMRQSILNRVAIVIKEVRSAVLTYLVESYAKGEQEVAEKRVDSLFGIGSPYSKEKQIALASHLSHPNFEEYLPVIREGFKRTTPTEYDGLVAAILAAPNYMEASDMVSELDDTNFWDRYDASAVELPVGRLISREDLVKRANLRGENDIPILLARLQGRFKSIDYDESGYTFHR